MPMPERTDRWQRNHAKIVSSSFPFKVNLIHPVATPPFQQTWLHPLTTLPAHHHRIRPKSLATVILFFFLQRYDIKQHHPNNSRKNRLVAIIIPPQLYLYKVTDFLNEYKCGYKRYILVAVKTIFASTPATLFGLDP